MNPLTWIVYEEQKIKNNQPILMKFYRQVFEEKNAERRLKPSETKTKVKCF